MKIQFNTKDFLQKLRIVKNVVDLKHPASILHNVKIVTDKKKGAVIHATDKKTSINLPVDCEVIVPGESLIPIADCIKILAATKEKTVVIEYTNGRATVGGKTRFDVPHPDEFPNVIAFSQKAYYEICGIDFAKMVKRTTFTVNEKDYKAEYHGVWFEFADKSNAVFAVATDGRRLAVQKGDVTAVNQPAEQPVLVPIKPLVLLEKIIKEKSGVPPCVQMAIVRNKGKSQTAVFQCRGVTLWSPLIEARPMPWRAIIPNDKAITTTIRCSDLIYAVEQLTVTNKKGEWEEDVLMTFRNNGGQSQLQLKNNCGDVTLPIAFAMGEVIATIVPSRLASVLKVLDADTVINIHLRTGNAIMVDTSDGFRYLMFVLGGVQVER